MTLHIIAIFSLSGMRVIESFYIIRTMKNTMIILCMITIVLSACKKENKGEKSMGEVQCEYNGVPWVSDLVRFTNENPYNTKGNIYFKIIKTNSNIRKEQILFRNISKNLFKQRLYKEFSDSDSTTSIYFTNDLEDDVGCDYYQVYEADSLNNWVQITKEVNHYGEIWGEFSVTYLKESGCPDSPYPDTVRIRNGTFHIWQ